MNDISLINQEFQWVSGQRLGYNFDSQQFFTVAKNAPLAKNQTTKLSVIRQKVDEIYHRSANETFKHQLILYQNIEHLNRAQVNYNRRLSEHRFWNCVNRIIEIFTCKKFSLEVRHLNISELKTSLSNPYLDPPNTYEEVSELLEHFVNAPLNNEDWLTHYKTRLVNHAIGMIRLPQCTDEFRERILKLASVLPQKQLFALDKCYPSYLLDLYEFLVSSPQSVQFSITQFRDVQRSLFDVLLDIDLSNSLLENEVANKYVPVLHLEFKNNPQSKQSILNSRKACLTILHILIERPEFLFEDQYKTMSKELMEQLLKTYSDKWDQSARQHFVHVLEGMNLHFPITWSELTSDVRESLLDTLSQKPGTPYPQENYKIGKIILDSCLKQYGYLNKAKKQLVLIEAQENEETDIRKKMELRTQKQNASAEVARCAVFSNTKERTAFFKLLLQQDKGLRNQLITRTVLIDLMRHLTIFPPEEQVTINVIVSTLSSTLTLEETRIYLEFIQAQKYNDQGLRSLLGQERIKEYFYYLTNNSKDICPATEIDEKEKKEADEKEKVKDEKGDLSYIAAQLCCIVRANALVGDNNGRLTIDILSRINVSRLPVIINKKTQEVSCEYFDEFRTIVAKDEFSTVTAKKIGVFATFIAKEPDKFLASANEEQLELYYREKECSELKINWAHFQVVAGDSDEVVPSVPPGTLVQYTELITMFDQINFTKPSQTGYVNPNSLEDDGIRITVVSLREGIKNFAERVTNPTYGPTDPTKFAIWKQNLERWVQHSIILIRDRKPEERSAFLIWLAQAGKHCGGKFYTIAHDLYCQVSGSEYSIEAETVEGTISTILAKKRFQILTSEFSKRASDTHVFAHTVRLTGKPFSVPKKEWTSFDYEDPVVSNHLRIQRDDGTYLLPTLHSSKDQDELLIACKRAYEPTLIINEISKHFNGMPGHPPTISQNFRQFALDQWFVDNMPKDFKNTSKNKINTSQAEQKYISDQFKDLVANELKKERSEYVEVENVRKVITTFRELHKTNSNFPIKEFTDEEIFLGQVKKVQNLFRAIYEKKFPPSNQTKCVLEILGKEKYEREIKNVRTEDFNAQYTSAVLSEVYYTDHGIGRNCIKRKWLIYLLQRISGNFSVFDCPKPSFLTQFFSWIKG